MAHTEQVDKATLWGGGRSPFGVTYGKMMMWFFLVSDALTFGGLLIAYGFARHSTTVEWPLGEEVFRSLPFAGDGFPLIYVALMTFILIVSSVTMVLAVEAGHRLNKKGVIRWLLLTVIGGAFFVGSQAWEWYHFIHGGHGVVITETSQRAYPSMRIEEGMTPDILRTEHPNFAMSYQRNAFEEGSEVENIISGEQAVQLWESKIDYITGASMTESEYSADKRYANLFFFITGFHGFHVFSGVIINLIILLMVVRGVFDTRGHYEMVEKVGLYWHFVDLVWVFVFTFFYLV